MSADGDPNRTFPRLSAEKAGSQFPVARRHDAGKHPRHEGLVCAFERLPWIEATKARCGDRFSDAPAWHELVKEVGVRHVSNPLDSR
jgi:hypothetical protein